MTLCLYFQLNLNPIGDEGMEGLINMIKLQPTLTYVSLEVKLQCITTAQLTFK